MYNEWIIHICIMHLMYLTDWLNEEEYFIFLLGWSILGWILLLIIVNLFFVIIYILKAIWFMYIKYKRIIKREMELRDNKELEKYLKQ